MSAFSLKSAAETFRKDEFEGWDSALDEFSGSFFGRRFRIDRFTTIYHRPTRRRHFTFDTGLEVPESRVIRSKVSGDTWVLSDTVKDEDWQATGVYDRVFSGHLVDAPSGGYSRYFTASADDGGGGFTTVSITDAGPIYLDTELRTSNLEKGTEEYAIGEFLLTLSPTYEMRAGDFVQKGGVWFRLEQLYIDGGYRMSRAVSEPPSYSDMLYAVDQGSGGGYNAATGVVTPETAVSTPFSGIVQQLDKSLDSTIPEYLENRMIYVYLHHIDFTPEVGGKITIDGDVFEVYSVGKSKSGVQWEIKTVFGGVVDSITEEVTHLGVGVTHLGVPVTHTS